MELVFVHGALVRDGHWWWRHAAELLEQRTGVRSRSVALPSCGETGAATVDTGLGADAAALREVLDGVDSAIVVGHSYGGTVIAEAGSHPAVTSLVYISSYLPETGTSQAEIMGGEPDPAAVADAGDGKLGLAGYTADSFRQRFLHDADVEAADAAWQRVTPQAVAAFVTPTSAAGWRGVDSTYLVCTEDRSTSVQLQRAHAARATRSVDLPTGHHPFLSRPDLVVDELQRVIDRA